MQIGLKITLKLRRRFDGEDYIIWNAAGTDLKTYFVTSFEEQCYLTRSRG